MYLENFVPGFTTEVTIPVVKVNIDFGWFYADFVFIMFTGESNGVNLSDGLDGLATGLSMVAIAPFIIYAIMIKDYTIASYATAMVEHYLDLCILTIILHVFLWEMLVLLDLVDF